jgi:hypothetical protein
MSAFIRWLTSIFRPSSPTPALGPLRLATSDDLQRLGLVAAAGFYYSPVFHYERPHHKSYPQDTFLSYEEQFGTALNSGDFVIVVAEDYCEPDEDSQTEVTFPSERGWQPPAAGEKVIVGLASIRLARTSKRRGQFHSKGILPSACFLHNRDRADHLQPHYLKYQTKEEILIESTMMAGVGVSLQRDNGMLTQDCLEHHFSDTKIVTVPRMPSLAC